MTVWDRLRGYMCKLFRNYLLIFVAHFWKDYSTVQARLHSTLNKCHLFIQMKLKYFLLISSAYHMTSGCICMCDLLMVTGFKAKLCHDFSMNINMHISQLHSTLAICIAATAGGAVMA